MTPVDVSWYAYYRALSALAWWVDDDVFVYRLHGWKVSAGWAAFRLVFHKNIGFVDIGNEFFAWKWDFNKKMA